MSGTSNGIQVKVVLTGQEALVARLKKAPTKLVSALKAEFTNLAIDLRDEAAAATNPKSGKLANSITAQVIVAGSNVSINLDSNGVDYADIQERGGTIPGDVIVAQQAKALAFIWAGGDNAKGDTSFFSAVAWPGATIPAKHFILGTLKANRANFVAIVERAIQTATQP